MTLAEFNFTETIVQRLFLATTLLLFVGCSLKNTHLYSSELLSVADQAVLSATGIYHSRQLSLQIIAIDGKPVDRLKTASFKVPAGTYQITLHAMKDFQSVVIANGFRISGQQADITVPLTVEGGHTYVPNAQVQGERISVFFDDKGLNYPTECLPLYQTVNNTSNLGLKLYSTKKKCEH